MRYFIQYPKEPESGKPLNNRLRGIFDSSPSGKYPTDIDNQTRFSSPGEAQAEQSPENRDDNYQYDEIGNLIQDKSANIDRIDWTVYGKIARITKAPEAGNEVIAYTYDASGNRISKLFFSAMSPSPATCARSKGHCSVTSKS